MLRFVIRTVSTLNDLGTEDIERVKKGSAWTCCRHFIVKVEKDENGSKSSEINIVALSCFERFFTQFKCLRNRYFAWKLSTTANCITIVSPKDLLTKKLKIDSQVNGKDIEGNQGSTVYLNETAEKVNDLASERALNQNEQNSGQTSEGLGDTGTSKSPSVLISPSFLFSPSLNPVVEGQSLESPMVRQKSTPPPFSPSPPPLFRLEMDEKMFSALDPANQRILRTIADGIAAREEHGPITIETTETDLPFFKNLIKKKGFSELFTKKIFNESVLYKVVTLSDEKNAVIGCKIYPESIDFSFEKMVLSLKQTAFAFPNLSKEIASTQKLVDPQVEEIIVQIAEPITLEKRANAPLYKMELTQEELTAFDKPMQKQLTTLLDVINTWSQALPVLVPPSANLDEALKKLAEKGFVSDLGVILHVEVLHYSFMPSEKYKIEN